MADTRYALGVEIPPVSGLRSEIGTMERLSEAMYAAARELRACDKPIAASAVEWGAFHLIGEANGWRPSLDGCGALITQDDGSWIGPCRRPPGHPVSGSERHIAADGSQFVSQDRNGNHY